MSFICSMTFSSLASSHSTATNWIDHACESDRRRVVVPSRCTVSSWASTLVRVLG